MNLTQQFVSITQNEQAKLFEEDEDRFYEEVDFRSDQELEWDKIKNEEESDFQIEEE